jgi:hypothetical protein
MNTATFSKSNALQIADANSSCLPWLDPVCFLLPCLGSVCPTVCSALAGYVLLVGASVADDVVPDGDSVWGAGLVLCSCVLTRCHSRSMLLYGMYHRLV